LASPTVIGFASSSALGTSVLVNMQLLLSIVKLLGAANIGAAVAVVRRDCSFTFAAENGDTCLSSMYTRLLARFKVPEIHGTYVAWQTPPEILLNS